MQPTSTAQFDAFERGGAPELEAVRDDVWALGQPMPGERLPASLLYIVRDAQRGLHVIDPGTGTDDNWVRFVDALTRIGAVPADVATVTATHLHADHLGMAERLRAETGAAVQLHGAEAAAARRLADGRPTPADARSRAAGWGVPEARVPALEAVAEAAPAVVAPEVDRLLADGDRLEIAGFDLRVVHTPGHTPGHVCLYEPDRRLVLTGDHVLPITVSGLGLGGPSSTNPLADFLASIDRVESLDEQAAQELQALPGHGYRFTGLGPRARACAEHHLRRTREVAGLEAASPSLSIWELASRLTWTGGFASLDGFTLWSALQQAEMHRDYVAAGLDASGEASG
ncbi:glyoxylase-like metal-dependent hydrolase (beta-lactamase superfamily II) [Frondihabitans sp. PhB188]|uniref:MBL fold metallo-hydrolase n=1 Tax=Frondihabitans sp. PhB188 TaxID=2485200 RepID=UPI000F943433|nr:MBL fold metallo-hydrolase [Frondihabitans sp. PhB188]ROQ37262.1 glyoxylase-like metal-dependent hydrolase (beta-lactamase superfamily II) [Frondihabitans sp. PhB188]